MDGEDTPLLNNNGKFIAAEEDPEDDGTITITLSRGAQIALVGTLFICVFCVCLYCVIRWKKRRRNEREILNVAVDRNLHLNVSVDLPNESPKDYSVVPVLKASPTQQKIQPKQTSPASGNNCITEQNNKNSIAEVEYDEDYEYYYD